MARKAIEARLSLLEQSVESLRRDSSGSVLADLPHGPLIVRLFSEFLTLVDSVAASDRHRVALLSDRLYVLLQLDGCIETSEKRLAGHLEWIARTETDQDEEFWAAEWPAEALPSSRRHS